MDDLLIISETLIRGLNKKHDCKMVDLHPEVVERFLALQLARQCTGAA